MVHGWVYFAYLLATFNLAVKVRWPLPKTIGVLPVSYTHLTLPTTYSV